MSGVEGIGASGGVAQVLVGPLSLVGTITPAALALGATNNYAPPNFATAAVVKLTSNAGGSTLTGLAGGTDNRYVTLLNNSGGTLTLAHLNAGSLAANRFFCPGAIDLVIAIGSAAALWYDVADGHWHVFAWS